MLKLNTNILLYKQPVWACVFFFFTSRLYVYNKVIVLSSVAMRLSFLIITIDHANPKVLCDSDACYTTQNNWVTYLQAKLPPPSIIFPRTLPTAHAIPAQHCISCETLPTPVCFCYTGTSHVSQKWVTCLPVKLVFYSISRDPSCSSLCPSSSLILLLGSRPEPSALPLCRQKHKQIEQR